MKSKAKLTPLIYAGNIHIEAENGLDGKGADADLSYVTQADDLSQLQRLLQPDTLTAEETAQLRALAEYYGIDPDDPEALAALTTPTSGASQAILTLDDDDLESDPEGGSPAQRQVRRILQAASNDSSQLFAGASAGLMALAVGANPVKAAVCSKEGSIRLKREAMVPKRIRLRTAPYCPGKSRVLASEFTRMA